MLTFVSISLYIYIYNRGYTQLIHMICYMIYYDMIVDFEHGHCVEKQTIEREK